MSLEKSKKLYGADLDVLEVAKGVDAIAPIVLEMTSAGKVTATKEQYDAMAATNRPVFIHVATSANIVLPVSKELVLSNSKYLPKISWLENSLESSTYYMNLYEASFGANLEVTRVKKARVQLTTV